jgi:acetolactate synthase-1/2/3 large subunit
MAEECERLSSNTMNIYNLTRLISAWTHGQVVVPASSGYAEETLTRFFRAGKGTRFFNGAALGSMGLGLPNALGAAFSAGRRVVCVEADGGIMLNLQELATLAHYAPKGFAIFLLNNHGYESIRVSQSRHFGILAGVDTDSGVFIPSFAKICAAFGLRYISIHNLKGFSDLLPTLDCNAPPVLVDLHIPNFEQRGPGVKTVMSPDGKPSTTPLSEIAW